MEGGKTKAKEGTIPEKNDRWAEEAGRKTQLGNRVTGRRTRHVHHLWSWLIMAYDLRRLAQGVLHTRGVLEESTISTEWN